MKINGKILKSNGNEKDPKWVAAGHKAARTRKINQLEREYNEAKSAGVKAAIRRKINAL